MGNNSSKVIKCKNSLTKLKLFTEKQISIKMCSQRKCRLKQSIENQSTESSISLVDGLSQNKFVLSEGNMNKNQAKKCERISIIAKSTYVKANLKGTIEQLKPSSIEIQLLSKILSGHCLFRYLDNKSMNSFIGKLSKCSIKTEEVVYSKDSLADRFYIVLHGKINMINSEKEIEKEIGECDTFGEWEILNNTIRKATAICEEEGILWSSTMSQFLDMIQSIRKNKSENIKANLNHLFNPTGGEVEIISKGITILSYKENTIINYNEIGNDKIFLLTKGVITVLDLNSQNEVKSINEGMLFGFKRLYCKSLYNYDYITKTECELYIVSLAYLKSIPGYNIPFDFTSFLLSKCFYGSKYLKDIKLSLLNKMLPLFLIKYYSNGEIVFKKAHNIENYLIILLDGKMLNYHYNTDDAAQGHILFEKEIYEKSSILLSNNLIASPDCLVAIAELNKIENLIGGTLKDQIDQRAKLKLLQRISLFEEFSDDKLEDVSRMMVSRKYDHGMVIIHQGERSEFFYLIKSGSVNFYNGEQYIKTHYANNFFGENSLYLNEPFHLSAISDGKVELYLLKMTAFNKIMTPLFQSYIKRQASIEDFSIELSDLYYVKTLGKGAFGEVNLVQSRKTGEQYAIKAINVNSGHSNIESYIESEKKVLLQLNHPLIMKIVKVFKQDSHAFFLLEYIKGKTLQVIIQLEIHLSKQSAQLYTASLLAIINYLHSKGIVYRDLKPSNIIITSKGQLKLIDFGIAKEIKMNKTSTIIGTPAYMAPEVIRGEPYGLEVDYWSIGICLYEFCCGKVPFTDNSKDPMNIYKCILEEPLTFPSFIHDKDYMKLLGKLLNKNVSRLEHFTEIRNEDWFKTFNWSTFANDIKHALYKSSPPPYFSNQRLKEKDRVSYLDYYLTNRNKESRLKVKHSAK